MIRSIISTALLTARAFASPAVTSGDYNAIVYDEASKHVNMDFVQALLNETNGDSYLSCGTCGTSYHACCAAYALMGYDCDCSLVDGSGGVHSNCGDCGIAYSTCCIGFAIEGDPCTCDLQ